MKKRPSSQNAPGGEVDSQSRPTADLLPSASLHQPTGGPDGSEKTASARGRTFKNDVADLDPKLQKLVGQMLVEGATIEDVVEAVNERGGDGITLSAVQNYFQGNLDIQKRRVQRLVENAEALLATVDKDPKSAEAQLARATFLTGYSRVHRNASLITPRDAERSRIERENLTLKHQILIMRRKKALQDLDYSRARTRLSC